MRRGRVTGACVDRCRVSTGRVKRELTSSATARRVVPFSCCHQVALRVSQALSQLTSGTRYNTACRLVPVARIRSRLYLAAEQMRDGYPSRRRKNDATQGHNPWALSMAEPLNMLTTPSRRLCMRPTPLREKPSSSFVHLSACQSPGDEKKTPTETCGRPDHPPSHGHVLKVVVD